MAFCPDCRTPERNDLTICRLFVCVIHWARSQGRGCGQFIHVAVVSLIQIDGALVSIIDVAACGGVNWALVYITVVKLVELDVDVIKLTDTAVVKLIQIDTCGLPLYS